MVCVLTDHLIHSQITSPVVCVSQTTSDTLELSPWGLCFHRSLNSQHTLLRHVSLPMTKVMTPLTENIRNSQMDVEEVYFWTDTIKDWIKVLSKDADKGVLISSLQELVMRGKIKIYAFVIMPNHIHLIWEMMEMNGKEMPHASFNKFTSHLLAKKIKFENLSLHSRFLVDESDRKVRIWQRDPLAVLMDTKAKVEQKIKYIHLNPLQVHWNLAVSPEAYKWSSARFYEVGQDEFGILTDYRERF